MQILASKGATGGILYRQPDCSRYPATGVIASDLPPSPIRAPDKALAIHSEAVGHALFAGCVNKRAAILDSAASSIEIVYIDHAQWRIGIIHQLVIGTPANPVRDAHASFH